MRTARFTLALLLLAAVTAMAQIPRTINYQGRARGTNNQPVTGSHGMTLKFYNSATGGAVLWSEAHNVIFTNDGIFTVGIGSQTPGGIPETLVFDEQYWIGVTITGVNGGAELSPRLILRSTPYSLHAQYAAAALVADAAYTLATPAAITGDKPDEVLVDIVNSGTGGSSTIGLRAEGEDYGVVSIGPVKTSEHYIAEGSAGNNGSPDPGSYYADNAPIAWAQIDIHGNIIADFGVARVSHQPQSGIYEITLNNPVELVPASKPAYAAFAPIITPGGDSAFPDVPVVIPQWAFKYGATTNPNIIVVAMQSFSGTIDFPFSIVVFGRPKP